MGVLARIFRRSKATEEATAETTSAADASTGTPADGVGAEQPGEPAPTQESAEVGVGAEKAEKAGEAAETETEKTTEPVAVAGTDGVEIPRQQSAEEAADSEAGEGART
ncbi:hypothetical protein ACFV4T_24125 [Streptomyces sp. NPDC059755]|uniref:hypothetical protein n=1 Tax=Streptomyces sp. NPDC059755 TaxID=3346934 RepID=UPI003652FF15